MPKVLTLKDQLVERATPSRIVAQGKTKQILRYIRPFSRVCRVVSNNMITAGDGARSDELPGKAILATTTTVNVFNLLGNRGLGATLAYQEPYDESSFLSSYTDMIQLEVVVRGRAGRAGSYRKRNTEVPEGTFFEHPTCELYLKTKNRRYNELSLACDDPFIYRPQELDGGCELYLPNKPLVGQVAMGTITLADLGISAGLLERIQVVACEAYEILRDAWGTLGYILEDIKFEFGLTADGFALRLSDVVDNDSWRLWDPREGRYICKQSYRDNEPLEVVLANYELVARLSAELR